MITRAQKEEMVEKLKKALTKNSVVFVNFRKLSNTETIMLRRQLRAEGIDYTVARKTLINRALEAQNFEGTVPMLEGEIAMAYGDDLLAPARTVYEFSKTHKEQVSIVGGIFNGHYKGREDMMTLALIPPLKTLQGMFVNLINSPIQRFAIAIDQIAQQKA